MQRKQLVYLLAILALLVSMLPLSAAAQEAPPAPFQIEEFAAPNNKAQGGSGAAGSSLPQAAPDGMSFFNETEPNDTAATANALPGSQVAVYGTISPATEVDFFSFTANAGDRVYAATQTQWSNGGSTDTVLDMYASNGTTVLETDDESGSFSGSSSAIGGTIIPAAGTYYIRVDGFSTTSTITPYYLHVRVQSGTPTAEVEPNNTTASATPLAASQWMSGTITATTDPDFFSFNLNAGDSVFLGLDMDPGRLPANTNWNGRLGLGLFNNFILVANDASTTKPHAEAMFMTVQQAGTYYAYVDSTSAAGLGPNARYHLSVSIYPKAAQQNCTTITSTDVPVTIGPGVGTATSTIVVPGTVTSAIQDINATIVLTHTNMLDLDVTLVGPTAASTALFTDIGSNTQTQMNIGLDDQAALPIGPYTVVSGMVNQPEQPGRLAAFNGTPAAGTWTLQLADDTTNTSGGRLQSWSLEVCGDPPPPYAIELNKTVGTEPGQCAVGDTITVPAGGATVYYCYTVRNIGLNTLTTHDLVDSELGALLTGVTYSLVPGATYSLIQQATVDATVTNTATWTAGDGVGVASDSDTATVNVAAPLCPAGFDDVILDVAVFDTGFPPTGWTVTNTSTGCVAPGVPQWTNTNPGNRANLTGGTGPFAIADSDRCGSGSTLDTIMTTSLLDFSGLISPTVSFNTDYDDIGATGDQALLDVSTDGGATWANLFTWDSDHRGPLLVTQALPGAAGENDVLVRWHYAQGTWDWWWQVDNAFLTACEPLVPAITLDKTVGADPTVCATTDQITLPAGGGDVTYCYEVANTGDVTLNLHDLDDSELGNILSGLNYALAPGASAFVTATANIAVTTVNTATWTAYNAGPINVVTATDTATVTVQAVTNPPNIFVDPLAVSSSQATNTQTQHTLTISNTGDLPLQWEIFEEPAVLAAGRPVDGAVAPVAAAQTSVAAAQDGDNEETLLEQARALAAEQNRTAVAPLPAAPPSRAPETTTHPLFVGVDDTTVPAYQVNVATNGFQQAFNGFQVWGSAYDPVNDKVYFNNGSTLYQWPVGGSVSTVGTIVNATGATQSMVGLAFYNGQLYGVKNIANEAIWAIDTTTLVATVHIDYTDADFDLGGFSADPNTGEFYATNDDTTPNGSGLFRMNPNGTGTLIAPYPAGQTDIDGLAVSDDGFAYLVTDEPGFIYVWDFTAGAYATPLNNPWTTSEIFSAGAWISQPQAQACTNPADVPWLITSPISGTTPAGDGADVTVTLDSTGLAPATYNANLCITSNDPDAGPGNETELVIVPVTLTVTAPTAVTLSGLAAAGETAPAQAPLPLAGVPLAALPAAIGLALGAAYVLRRKE